MPELCARLYQFRSSLLIILAKTVYASRTGNHLLTDARVSVHTEGIVSNSNCLP